MFTLFVSCLKIIILKKKKHLSTDNVLMLSFESKSIHFNIKVYFLHAIGPTQRKFVLLNIC